MKATKECTMCHETKLLRDFYKHPSTTDGRQPRCKECTKAAARKFHKEHPEYTKAQYQKHKEKRREYAHKQYQQKRAVKSTTTIKET
jgi:hypothetical protein